MTDRPEGAVAGPLSGILVVSIEQAVAAPLCTLRMADAGARIIKVEAPGGDRARQYDEAVNGTSAIFAWLNRGKESVVLDLKAEADLALAHRMVERADILVQNLAPGASARLGLGAAAMTARHPRLVAVDIVGYGQDTPCAERRAYDMLIQAESGICAVTGTPETPSKVGVSLADIATGTNAYAAALEALFMRERTGRGQSIEVAMFDGMVEWMTPPLLHYEHLGIETQRYGLSHAAVYPYRPYDCRDGAIVIAIQSTAEWTRFCAGVLCRPEVAEDPRFASNFLRVTNRDALDAVIAPAFAAMDCAETTARLETHQIAWARVSSVADLAAHPALRRMPALLPDGSRFDLPRPAGRLPLGPHCIPDLGAHTERIRREFAA